ncbi:MAG: hypothetical protein AAF355_11140 [Myxococcota bacterium]
MLPKQMLKRLQETYNRLLETGRSERHALQKLLEIVRKSGHFYEERQLTKALSVAKREDRFRNWNRSLEHVAARLRTEEILSYCQTTSVDEIKIRLEEEGLALGISRLENCILLWKNEYTTQLLNHASVERDIADRTPQNQPDSVLETTQRQLPPELRAEALFDLPESNQAVTVPPIRADVDKALRSVKSRTRHCSPEQIRKALCTICNSEKTQGRETSLQIVAARLRTEEIIYRFYDVPPHEICILLRVEGLSERSNDLRGQVLNWKANYSSISSDSA